MCSGHVDALVVAKRDQEVVDPDHVVGVAGEGRPDHGGDADRVLVDVGLHVLGADRVLVGLQRHDPRLDVEVAAELLPDDVHVAAEDEVRLVGRLARRLAALAPLPLQRQGPEHDRLRGALGAGAGGLAGGVEEVGEHADAALLDLGGLRVLGVVDEVAVQVLGDDLLRLGLHPGGHERRQVALRDAVEHELLGDQAHRRDRLHRGLRELVVGHALGKPLGGDAVIEQRGLVVVHSCLLGVGGGIQPQEPTLSRGARDHPVWVMWSLPRWLEPARGSARPPRSRGRRRASAR